MINNISIWEKETFFSKQDVIIIGSGFTGLWSAIKLLEKKPTLKITILERGLIPTGASTKNAGFSCFGSPSELLNDCDTLGEDATFKLVEERYKGLLEIRKYFKDEEIEYEATGGYECFANDSKDWESTIDKLAWLNKKMQAITGVNNTYTIVDEKLKTLGLQQFNHLIENKLEGGLHSGKLIQALLKKVYSLNAQILTNVEVTAFNSNADTVTVQTKQGITFSTKKLLLCTNAFTKSLIADADIIPNRGQVLVTGEIKNLFLKGSFHFDRGYYYFRNLGNRILIGGARNKAVNEESTTNMDITDTIQKELENFISTYLLTNVSFTVTDRWSGIMAMGSVKAPIVKELQQNIFCCVRMSGMGVALAPIVAEQISSILCNK